MAYITRGEEGRRGGREAQGGKLEGREGRGGGTEINCKHTVIKRKNNYK